MCWCLRSEIFRDFTQRSMLVSIQKFREQPIDQIVKRQAHSLTLEITFLQ